MNSSSDPEANSTSICNKLHLRPQDTPLDLETTIRELTIHWSLSGSVTPETVASLLRLYARLLDQKETSLFRKVLNEMIEEQSKPVVFPDPYDEWFDIGGEG